jgi:hypothetical protein
MPFFIISLPASGFQCLLAPAAPSPYFVSRHVPQWLRNRTQELRSTTRAKRVRCKFTGHVGGHIETSISAFAEHHLPPSAHLLTIESSHLPAASQPLVAGNGGVRLRVACLDWRRTAKRHGGGR